MSALDGYMLCTTPRSGSTLLCAMLTDTGVAGIPKSYFHRPDVAAWATALGLGADRYTSRPALMAAVLEASKKQGKGATGIFGCRLQAGSLRFFLDSLAEHYPKSATDRDRLRAAFGKLRFIYLRREDYLEQAVSLVIAEQSGLWHRKADGSELERNAPHKDPVYDGREIRRKLKELQGLNATWEGWFAAEEIEPVRIRYADLSERPNATLRRILNALGQDPDRADGVVPATRKLADSQSSEWVARFRKEEQKP